MEDGRRVVCQNDDFLVLEPFASRFPFETWLLPKRHEQSFEAMNDESIPALAALFRELLGRLNVALNRPPYNFVLHTSPCNDIEEPHHFHWHIELMPKLTKVAGFEWGTGFYINPTPPEEAAEFLRAVVLPAEEDPVVPFEVSEPPPGP